jgi:hypothetical protein
MNSTTRILPEAPLKCSCGNWNVWDGECWHCVQGHRRYGYAPPREALESWVRYDADKAARLGRGHGTKCDFCGERHYGHTWLVTGRDGITLCACSACLLADAEE